MATRLLHAAPRPEAPVAPVRVGIPLALLLATQPIDVLTTALVVGSGAGHEGNPLTLMVLNAGGYGLMLVVKLALVAAIAAEAVILGRQSVTRARRYLMVATVMYTAIVAWNGVILVGRLGA
jgi:hypothetical protein